MQWCAPVIPSYSGAEIRRIVIPGQPREVLRLHVNGKKLGIMASACHPCYSRKHKIEGSQSRPGWAKSETICPKCFKITTAKRNRDAAQVVSGRAPAQQGPSPGYHLKKF
jgi:hypothetical protein